jgi:hypothetical protein
VDRKSRAGHPGAREDRQDRRDERSAADYGTWSAVLLIAAALSDSELARFHALAHEVDLDALVEVHDEPELERALAAGAELIGVNNRDLRDFKTDVGVTHALLPLAAGRTVVSESGLDSPEVLRALEGAGASAFLIGEALMREPDPGAALRRDQILVARSTDPGWVFLMAASAGLVADLMGARVPRAWSPRAAATMNAPCAGLILQRATAMSNRRPTKRPTWDRLMKTGARSAIFRTTHGGAFPSRGGGAASSRSGSRRNGPTISRSFSGS